MSTSKKTKSCTIRDLARYVNVSPGTVSRVLNHKNSNVKITEETKKRIFEAVKKLNYSPNIHAKRLFSNKSMTIGVVIPDQQNMVMNQHIFSDYNLSESLSGIEKVATSNNYRLLLLVCTKKFLTEKHYLQLFREKCIDGLIFWGAGSNSIFNKELSDEQLPFVLANSDHLETDYPKVNSDNVTGSFNITEYLIKKGRKKIAYIKGKPDSPVTIDRNAGFMQAIKKYNIKLNPKLMLQGDYSIESGYLKTKQLIDQNIKFDTIVAGNDMMAIGAMRALQETGIDIPTNTSVVGADNIQLAKFACVPLTTYFTDMFTLGEKAMKLLIANINNDKNKNEQIIIPTKLIIRKSS